MSQSHKPYAGGSIPENYETHLVPLLFLDYAADLASRVDVPKGGTVLETACGTGAVTRHLRTHLGDDVRLTVTDLAPSMVEQAQKILDTIGVGGERARMFNLSSSEGPRFAQYATDFTAEIKELGPNPLKLAKNKAA